MAIKIFEKFTPRANPADGDYPYGSIKNESVPGAKDGTPLDAVWGNDYAGFDAALLAEAGVVPSGNPDTVVASQRLEALLHIINRNPYTLTMVEAKASQLVAVGTFKELSDRENGKFKYLEGQTPNNFNVIQSTGVPALSLVLQMDGSTTSKQFGLIGDGSANDEAANLAFITAASAVNYSEGTYIIDRMPDLGSRQYVGLGTVNIKFQGTGDPLCKLSGNSSYKNINFSSLILTKDSQRGAIDDTADVYIEKCGFSDFVDTGVGNAWGVLIQRSTRITLDRCSFSNNTQADIALTDDCSNINIINPKNTADGGVLLNVEPNASSGVVGMNVIGGHFREITLLENSNTAYASRNIIVQGARIDSLTYDGSGVDFQNCTIGEIKPEGQEQVVSFAGSLRCNTIQLGPNILEDSYLFDVSVGDATTFWASSGTASPLQQRFNSSISGKFNRLNPARGNLQTIVATRNFIPVVAGESFLTFLRARVDNVGTGTSTVDIMQIIWYDAAFAEIKRTNIKCCRGAVNTVVDWKNDVGAVKAPALAAHMKVRVSTNFTLNTTASVDVARIGVFRYDLLTAGDSGNMNHVFGEMSKVVTNNDYVKSDVFPGTNQGYAGAFVGERIIRSAPASGQPVAWSCSTLPSSPGLSGVFLSEGLL